MNSDFDIYYAITVVYVLLTGLCIGSFLNVVILRALTGESIVLPSSKCPKCNNKLKWYMNIPLFSYIFLKGKCAFCKTKISFQYPLVELICGLSFLAAFYAFNLTLKTLFICIFFSVFIVLSGTDFKQKIIFDKHAYFLYICALLYSLLKLSDISILNSFISSIAAFLIFELTARLSQKIIGYRMFGEGDSLIALGIGAIFGIKNLLIVIPLSVLIQGIIALPVLIKNSYQKNKKPLTLSYIFVLFSLMYIFISAAFDLINRYPCLYVFSSVVVAGLLLWALKNITFDLKDKKEEFNCANKTDENAENIFSLLPFGPSLIFAATICIFYIEPVKNAIYKFFFL